MGCMWGDCVEEAFVQLDDRRWLVLLLGGNG